MIELYGRGVSNGIAIGKLIYYTNNTTIPEYEIQDTEAELLRYRNGMKLAKKKLEKLYKSACERVSKNESVIFQTHIMILEDSKFVDMVENNISIKKKNAEYAVHTTTLKLANIFKELDDDYLQERYCDIIDAGNTLLDILQHKSDISEKSTDEPVIIAADDLLPSETISFKKECLLGFITNRGTQTSHSSILARTMGVPSVIQVKEPLIHYNGMNAIIDGQLGKVIINPDKNTIALYHAKKERYNKQRELLKRQIGLEAVTKNGQHITLSANIGLLEDLESAKENDAENIGLFRSDFLFLHRNSYPTEEEQFEVYKTVIKAMKNRKTVIRTVDVGADKQIDYLDIPEETNPAMGFRGIRICLSNNDFFKVQLRALYRASVYGKLCLLLPMIDSIEEIEFVKRIIEKVKIELSANGQPYDENVEIGAMIETPAAALISDEICKYVDFVSIGTNDLTQYTLAIDRGNQKLEYFYRPYHKAILRLIKMVSENAHKNGKRVSICGELASDTAMTQTFLALKIDELSMVPSKILKVKAKVRDSDTSDCSEILSKI